MREEKTRKTRMSSVGSGVDKKVRKHVRASPNGGNKREAKIKEEEI